jgi:hypothetical protein
LPGGKKLLKVFKPNTFPWHQMVRNGKSGLNEETEMKAGLWTGAALLLLSTALTADVKETEEMSFPVNEGAHRGCRWIRR